MEGSAGAVEFMLEAEGAVASLSLSAVLCNCGGKGAEALKML